MRRTVGFNPCYGAQAIFRIEHHATSCYFAIIMIGNSFADSPVSTEAEILEASDPVRLAPDPLVSVFMLTYNHAAFLAKAIEGVVSQQCEFPFELVIGEDASQDATLAIALEYQRRYPHIVRVVYSRSNVGANANKNRVFKRLRGEFIAYCQGDDYWCSPHKLARQVDLIRTDLRVGIVHADWVRSKCRQGAWHHDFRKSVHRRVPPRLLQGDLFATWHFPKILRSCTVLVRRSTLVELSASGLVQREYRFGDSVLSAYVTSKWLVAYVPDVVAVYHESPNSALRSGSHSRVMLYKSCLEFDTDARAYFAGRANYGDGYRWEVSIALLMWSIRARDARSAYFALRDICGHFSPLRFLIVGCRTIAMRWPTLRRQPRGLPTPAVSMADQ
jgi:glycosyltransferase involved in cell wall biosynthesis